MRIPLGVVRQYMPDEPPKWVPHISPSFGEMWENLTAARDPYLPTKNLVR
jgi:hypothetical protein